MSQKLLERGLRDLGRRERQLATQLARDAIDERDQILARPRAQRRQHDGQHAQSIIEILAKAPRVHLLDEILARGNDRSDVHREVLNASRAPKLLRLQQPQELPLHRQVER